MDNNGTRANGSLEEHSSSPDNAPATRPDEVSAQTMFSPQPNAWEETRKAERRRIAMWGLATGGVMAAILGLCVLLAYLASST